MLSFLFLNLESISGSVVPDSFELATEKRAKERQEFEKRLAELEAQKERLQEEARRQVEEQSKEEVARLRQELVNEQAFLGKDHKSLAGFSNVLNVPLSELSTLHWSSFLRLSRPTLTSVPLLRC